VSVLKFGNPPKTRMWYNKSDNATPIGGSALQCTARIGELGCEIWSVMARQSSETLLVGVMGNGLVPSRIAWRNLSTKDGQGIWTSTEDTRMNVARTSRLTSGKDVMSMMRSLKVHGSSQALTMTSSTSSGGRRGTSFVEGGEKSDISTHNYAEGFLSLVLPLSGRSETAGPLTFRVCGTSQDMENPSFMSWPDLFPLDGNKTMQNMLGVRIGRRIQPRESAPHLSGKDLALITETPWHLSETNDMTCTLNAQDHN